MQTVHSSRNTTAPSGPLVLLDRPAESAASRDAAEGAADDWPVISGIVRDSAKSKGNFGLGEGTASQATRAGESWVGDGYRVASDGKTLVSRDGLRTFRPPSWKPDLGKYQANFEYWLEQRVGKPFGNGHLDITDLGP
jgi:filamentous hemagglutinin